MDRLDFVVFGATGFTGARVCLELARVCSTSGNEALFGASATNRPAFGIAGRSRQRLEAVSKQTRMRVPHFLGEIKIIIADVGDDASLLECARSARLLINCVGPFRFYGEAVVKACVAAQTDYVDITGEPEFMERMELKYGDEATKQNVLIVPCCGFDSIPADVGAMVAVDTMRQSGYLCTAVESYFTVTGGTAGFRGHYATWESAVNGYGSAGDLRRVRKEYLQLHPEASSVPTYGPRLPRRSGLAFWSRQQSRWALPFMGSDASVVRRTQRNLAVRMQQRQPQQEQDRQVAGAGGGPAASAPLVPIQYAAYFTVKSTYYLIVTLACGAVVSLLAGYSWGRRLLLAWPRVFTFGMFSHEGPTEEQMATTTFVMTHYARGYSNGDSMKAVLEGAGASSGSSNRSAQLRSPMSDAAAAIRITGPEPGYVATPKFVLSAAFTALLERQSLQYQGGVLTPATAFRGTRLVDRMKKLGIAVDIVEAPHAIAAAAR